jgi:MFS family permease
MATFSVASLLFGHLAHHYNVFRLMSLGALIWVVAITGSGISYWLPRKPFAFWVFISSRALSGFGGARTSLPPHRGSRT